MRSLTRVLRALHHTTRLNSGQAIVIIALAAIGLFAMMGLAIDGGRLLFLQRDTRNAADAAAVAAARALCTARPPEPYALAAASQNGFDNNQTDNWVTVNSPPLNADYAIPDACKGCYVEVEVKGLIPPSFIGIVYDGELAATGDAIGVCNPDLDASASAAPQIRAAWAMSESCAPDPIKISGSSIHIEGGFHSNGEAAIEGSASAGNTISGASSVVVASGKAGEVVQGQDKITWSAGSGGSDGDDTTFPGGSCLASCFAVGDDTGESIPPDGTPYLTEKKTEWPVDYDINDYNDPTAAGTPAADANGADKYYEVPSGDCKKFGKWLGDNHVTGSSIDNGIYFGDCDLTIDNQMPDGLSGNITIVATGTIKVVQAQDINWGPYDGNLLMFANGNEGCNFAIQFSGNNNTWNGNIFAPNGAIKMAAATNSTDIQGCLIGNAVELSGSNNTINCITDTEKSEPNPGIWLAK